MWWWRKWWWWLLFLVPFPYIFSSLFLYIPSAYISMFRSGFLLYFSLSICAGRSVSVCLSVSICQSVCVYLSICIPVSVCLYTTVCLSINFCMSVYTSLNLNLSHQQLTHSSTYLLNYPCIYRCNILSIYLSRLYLSTSLPFLSQLSNLIIRSQKHP